MELNDQTVQHAFSLNRREARHAAATGQGERQYSATHVLWTLWVIGAIPAHEYMSVQNELRFLSQRRTARTLEELGITTTPEAP